MLYPQNRQRLAAAGLSELRLSGCAVRAKISSKKANPAHGCKEKAEEINKGGVMENSAWWIPHLLVIAIQLAAFAVYFLGSYRFYNCEDGYLKFIGLGILLDILLAFGASFGWLPRMAESQGAPWSSVLFLIHVICAGGGMLGFLFVFFYTLVRGPHPYHFRLGWFQYRVLLPL